MLQTHKKTLRYAIILLTLFLLLGGSMTLLYQRVVLASAAVKEAEGAIAVLEYKERGIGNNKRGLEELSTHLTALEESFVSQYTFVQFVELLERLAQETGVVFRAQGAALPLSASPKEKTSLRFEIQGNYAELVRFFILLDAIPYAGFVEDARVTPLGKDAETLRASVTFTIFNFSPTP